MAIILNTMYPPQVDTFMPSFRYNNPAIIWFKISSYDEDKQIQYIHVSMVDQRTNRSVFAGNYTSGGKTTTVYPQFYPISFNDAVYDENKKMYKISIPPQVLKTAPYYNVGQYYKVQLRFDLTDSLGYLNNYSDRPVTDYFYWNGSSKKATANALYLAGYSNANEKNFSEWSTGTLIKPILIPNLNLTSSTKVNPSTDTRITAALTFVKASSDGYRVDSTEWLSSYQIKILDSDKNYTYYDSGQIYTNIKDNKINCRVNTLELTVNATYCLRFIYSTNSGYIETKDYFITIQEYYNNVTEFHYNIEKYEEKGIIKLEFTELSNYDGFLIVRRSSHYSNFMDWDLIATKDISGLDFNRFVIIDKTIESMTGYCYQLQYISNKGTFYKPQYTDIIHCDFYGALLSDNEKMLKISFNFQINNIINASNRTKVDTLGGQYPIFTQNPKLKYHTYSISGRISTEDDGELFLPKEKIFGSKYYNYRYIYTPNPRVAGNIDPHNSECQKIKPNSDWLYEREYRKVVEEWLNNGKPKLFRTMTEGNIIVMLDGISITPDQVLGRRLYDFSATMYEIGDGKDLDTIVSFGLFDIINETIK